MPLSEDLTRLIELELTALKGPAFLRTSYGMAKENPFAYAPVTTVREVEGVLRWKDARLLRFFGERLASGDPASLFLRQWVSRVHQGAQDHWGQPVSGACLLS
jgi:hypothetical protein